VGSALPWQWFKEMVFRSDCIHARFFLVGSPPRMTRVYVSKMRADGLQIAGSGVFVKSGRRQAR
jgi:hypothetical protein